MRTSTALRALGCARVAVGAASLIALGRPGWVRSVALQPRAVLAARVLGCRDVAQGALLAAAPAPSLARLGTVVDTLHGLSMLALAGTAPRYRRAAGVSAVTAAGWVALEQLAVRRLPPG